jgi:hypothetical protein
MEESTASVGRMADMAGMEAMEVLADTAWEVMGSAIWVDQGRRVIPAGVLF